MKKLLEINRWWNWKSKYLIEAAYAIALNALRTICQAIRRTRPYNFIFVQTNRFVSEEILRFIH